MSDLTAVSLFAGVGGFDLALSRAGVKVVAAVEIDKKCREVLGEHFPETKLFDDVKGVTGEQLQSAGFIPERGIITGGFPCQDLSIAGLRKGLAGERSGLFHEIIRLTDELQPQFIILENVAGLLSSQSGKDMGIVITALVERGYGVCWRVLDSQNFGVPQRRRRVFIVASFGDNRRPVEILFERESLSGYFEPSRKKRKETANRVEAGIDESSESVNVFNPQILRMRSGKDGGGKGALVSDNKSLTIATSNDQSLFLFEGNRVGDPRFHDEVSPSVIARWGTGGNNVPLLAFPMHGGMVNRKLENRPSGSGFKDDGDPSFTLTASSQAIHGVVVAQKQSNSEYILDNKTSTITAHEHKQFSDLIFENVTPIQDSRELEKNQNGLGVGQVNEPSYTLDATRSQAIASNIVRRLTPKECERLQGFPDNWTAKHPDSARDKMMGSCCNCPCC